MKIRSLRHVIYFIVPESVCLVSTITKREDVTKGRSRDLQSYSLYHIRVVILGQGNRNDDEECCFRIIFLSKLSEKSFTKNSLQNPPKTPVANVVISVLGIVPEHMISMSRR